MVTRRLRISGNVQGVGYRYALREQAERLGVTGWVRNRRDGTVEADIQGEPGAVDALAAWARHGPPGSRVVEVRTEPAPADAPAYTRFEIAPTI